MQSKFIIFSLLFIILALLCDHHVMHKFNYLSAQELNKNTLFGWQLNNSNTGLKGNYSKLSLFNLNGTDSGKGAWIGGVGYKLHIKANQTIKNKIFKITRGYLDLTAGNITLRNCLIQPIGVADGMMMVIADNNAVIEDCEIDGSLLGMSNVAHGCLALTNSIVRRTIMHFCDIGVMAYNTKGITLIDQTYTYDVFLQPGSSDHIAGMSIWSATGEGILITNNKVIVPDGKDQNTSGAFFSQSRLGNIRNITITGNLFQSAGYVIHLTNSTYKTLMPYTIANNRLQLFSSHKWGWGYYGNSTTIIPAWSENYSYNEKDGSDKGEAISIKKN